MHKPLIQEALEALWGVGDKWHHESIGGGLINYSFCATAQLDERVFLQQINGAVFSHPDRISVICNSFTQHYRSERLPN